MNSLIHLSLYHWWWITSRQKQQYFIILLNKNMSIFNKFAMIIIYWCSIHEMPVFVNSKPIYTKSLTQLEVTKLKKYICHTKPQRVNARQGVLGVMAPYTDDGTPLHQIKQMTFALVALLNNTILSGAVKAMQTPRAPFHWHGLTLILAWISNLMPINVWDEITYPFPNFNGAAVEVWEWISNFILHFLLDVIISPC